MLAKAISQRSPIKSPDLIPRKKHVLKRFMHTRTQNLLDDAVVKKDAVAAVEAQSKGFEDRTRNLTGLMENLSSETDSFFKSIEH